MTIVVYQSQTSHAQASEAPQVFAHSTLQQITTIPHHHPVHTDSHRVDEVVLLNGNATQIPSWVAELTTRHPHCQRFHLAYEDSAGQVGNDSSLDPHSTAHQLAQRLRQADPAKHFVVIGYTTQVFLNTYTKQRYQHTPLTMCGDTLRHLHHPRDRECCYFDGRNDSTSLSLEFQRRYVWCEQAMQILNYHLAQWKTGTAKATVLQEVIHLCQDYLYQRQFNQVYGLLTCCLHPTLAGQLFAPTTAQSSCAHYHNVMAKRRYLPGMAPTLIEIREHLAAGRSYFHDMDTRQCLQELIDKLTQRQQKWATGTPKHRELTQLIQNLQWRLDHHQLQIASVRQTLQQGLNNSTLHNHQHPYWDRLFFGSKSKTTTEKTLEQSLTKLQECQDSIESVGSTPKF